MLHGGMGERQVNVFLTSMNIPPMRPSTLKILERTVDPTIEQVTEELMQHASREEERLTREL